MVFNDYDFGSGFLDMLSFKLMIISLKCYINQSQQYTSELSATE